MIYYVIKDKATGEYFRGKGINRWGKYFNQTSIYRSKYYAEQCVKETAWKSNEKPIIVEVEIKEVENNA